LGRSPAPDGDRARDRRLALQFRVLFAQLLELPQFAQPQPGVFPFPRVENLLGDLELPAHLHNGRPGLPLPQGCQDLLFRMPTSSCGSSFGEEDHVASPVLQPLVAYFSGFGSPGIKLSNDPPPCLKQGISCGGIVKGSKKTSTPHKYAELLILAFFISKPGPTYTPSIC